MLTPILLLVVGINIVGLLSNYNIKNHPLDIRVKRDGQAELQYEEPLQLLNETTNHVFNRNTSDDEPEDGEVTKEHEADMDVAYSSENDFFLNYTGYNETETHKVIEDDDFAPEKKSFDDNLASDSLLNESDNRNIELNDKMIRNKSEFTKNATEEFDKELMNSVSRYNNIVLPETVATGARALLVNEILENLFKIQSNREDENFDAKQEIEIIKQQDDELTKLKNYENNKTQEELTKYDHEAPEHNAVLDIIIILRDDDVHEKETVGRGKRYAPYGDGSFNASPNDTKSGGAENRRGVEPGFVGNYTAYGAVLSNFNSSYRLYTPRHPNNTNVHPHNNFNGRNTNYTHYNRNYAHQYSNYNNQQPNNNNDVTNRANFPTHPINLNTTNIDHTYGTHGPIAPYNNRPYSYNGNPGNYQTYPRVNPHGGNQNVPAHSTNGNGIYTSNFYNNHYPKYNQSSNANGGASDGGRAPGAPGAPGSNGNGTLTSNSTTAVPYIVKSCILCGSSGCPYFLKKMGFLCVPLDDEQ